MFLDRTGSPSHPTVPILGGAFSIILQRTGVALDFFTLPTATFLAGKYFGTAVVSIREVYADGCSLGFCSEDVRRSSIPRYRSMATKGS